MADGLLISKIISMIMLGLITWIIGLSPIVGVKRGWLQNIEETPRRVLLYSVLLCFGGGVILTSCLTHMLPDVSEIYEQAVAEKQFPDSGLAVPEILVLAGFLLIYIIEELAHGILEKCGIIISDHGGGGGVDRSDDHEKAGGHDQHSKAAAGGHGHSHDIELADTSDTVQATARGFLVILALCIHDLFEGIALGVSSQESAVWFLLLAFASHKFVIAACLGMKWSRSALKPLIAIFYMTTFCAVSPVGVMVGMLLTDPSQESQLMTSALIVLQGIATGSLLYVVFFEILEKERQKNVSGIVQAFAFTGGYLFMVVLGLAEVRSQSEEETGGVALAPNVTKAFI